MRPILTKSSPDSYRGQNSDYDIVLSSNPPNDGPPPARGDTMLSVGTDQYFSFGASSANLPTADLSRRPSDILNAVSNYNAYASPPNDTFEDYNEYPTTGARGPLELHQEDWDEWGPADPEELDENRFVNFSLLSHISVQLRDKVPRGTHVKGSIPYPRAFTGRDIVSTIQALIQRELAINHGISTTDRRQALLVARSLQSQLFFYEAEWGGRVLQDGVEDVYMFLDDQEGPSENMGVMREELPTGVVTAMTQCYAPGCGEEGTVCYSPRCPRRVSAFSATALVFGANIDHFLSRGKQHYLTLPRLSSRRREYILPRGQRQYQGKYWYLFLIQRFVGKRMCLKFCRAKQH